jgi:hypothetical protein
MNVAHGEARAPQAVMAGNYAEAEAAGTLQDSPEVVEAGTPVPEGTTPPVENAPGSYERLLGMFGQPVLPPPEVAHPVE